MRKCFPGFLIDYDRVNERYDNQYKNESKAFTTLQIATWVVLLISSIGIFSMSLFVSVKRQKEFGIRKVVGATATQIASLHTRHFLKIGLFANVIALPIAYYLMHKWLEGFVYRTDVSTLHFFAIGSLLLVFVALVVGYSAWKSGRMNPVDVIKME